MRLALILSLFYIFTDASSEDSSEVPKKWRKMKMIRRGPEPGFPMMPMMPMMPPPAFRGKFIGGMRQRGMRSPSFLREANEENRKAIMSVMGDRSLSIEEKDSKIEEILKSDSPKAQEAFVKFKADMVARREAMEKDLANRREKLSPAAKEADEALSKIMKDETLGQSERREQLKELFGSLPMEVQNELKQMRRGYQKNKVARKIKEVGDFIGDIRMGIHDAFRSAVGLRPPMISARFIPQQPEQTQQMISAVTVPQQPEQPEEREPVRRAPMRRLPPKYPMPDLQLETKPIKVSDDDKFIEF